MKVRYRERAINFRLLREEEQKKGRKYPKSQITHLKEKTGRRRRRKSVTRK